MLHCKKENLILREVSRQLSGRNSHWGTLQGDISLPFDMTIIVLGQHTKK